MLRMMVKLHSMRLTAEEEAGEVAGVFTFKLLKEW